MYSSNGKFPLHEAVARGDLDFIKLLLEKGANVNSIDDEDKTPIHVSSAYLHCNKLKIFELLLENGAHMEVKYRCTCKRYKMNYCSGECDCDHDPRDGPLHYSCIIGDVGMCKLLIQNGANIDAKGEDDNTPIHYMSGGYPHEPRMTLRILKVLLDSGANIEAENDHGMTPLLFACDYGFFEIVKLLLEKGASFSTRRSFRSFRIGGHNDEELTPLELASRNGHTEVVIVFREYISSKKIQSFFRIIMAKNIVNRLRMEPTNLFDPEFSIMRKSMLKIDDSWFF
jgi:cytohesin